MRQPNSDFGDTVGVFVATVHGNHSLGNTPHPADDRLKGEASTVRDAAIRGWLENKFDFDFEGVQTLSNHNMGPSSHVQLLSNPVQARHYRPDDNKIAKEFGTEIK